MRYSVAAKKRTWPRRLIIGIIVLILLTLGATIAVRRVYFDDLRPVQTGSQAVHLITVARGATLDQIAKQLRDAGLIRSAWAFKLYVGSKNVRDELQAGTYSFGPSQSVQQIVVQLTHGKVAVDLVTIIPGQRLDQVSTTLLNYGFKDTDVAAALQPDTYAGNPALVDKPAGASLEGYIYPDSYQKDSSTTPQQIIQKALDAMDQKLTPDLRQAFAVQGLSTYQAIVLASIVEQEVSNPNDRAQVAQVFLKRMRAGMTLGSDVTAYYGSRLAGQGKSLQYDSPYNTRIHVGLPPTPISNVTIGALQAVASPASTDWLYFVAGDDGATHFAHTLDEHDANVAKYCQKLCSQ